ncbi:MAG: phosphate ABC transporter substrate-binding protein PstS [Acidobacteriaceae bacterium]|nr:phosphate ABC transporter substrate-binding protein PstS [Acidobacteriaceae bacterium]
MKMKFISALLLAGMAATAGAQNLTGAGATFPYPIYSKWFNEYSASHKGVQINYQSIGSGGGIRQVTTKIVDFGASDMPMTDQMLKDSKVRLAHIPTVLGAVVPVYNIPGVAKDLNFSPDVLADIYLGKINSWHDARIAKDNPGVNFPDHQILPVYRSDGSGTNFIFTDFLSKVSPDFQSRVGKGTSVRWPTGIGQKGNEGIAGMVRNSTYSIGYVELIYAVQNKMSYGQVKNAAGKFVKASTESVTAAASGASKNMPLDFRVSITNAPGAASYPISSFTYLLIPMQSADPAKGKILVDFLRWMLDHGEGEAAAMTYAPLPKPVEDRVRGALNYIH